MSFVIGLVALFFALPSAQALRANTEVRVRLHKGLKVVEVSGVELQIGDPSPIVDGAVSSGLERAKIRRLKSGVWLVKVEGAKTWVLAKSDVLTVRGQSMRVGVHPAPYDLELIASPGRGIDVVARMELETYLGGVLPSEMPATWHLQALKAQAVAARSFVLRMAFERRNKHFDVDSTVFDQVYTFFAEVENRPDLGEKINRALKETRGEILVDRRRRVLKAFYSADCGCQSEDPKFVWGKSDGFESVSDPSCGDRRPRTWKIELGRSEVREKLVAALGLPSDSSLRTLNIGQRTPSGRVSEVIAAMEVAGKTKNIGLKSQEFRRIFGFDRVRSTDFNLRWMADQLEINGRGLGHGVGLCQRGAQGLAEQGMDYREILKLYYPKAKLVAPKST